MAAMYVRIKRKTDTYFEGVDQNDTFLLIKQRLSSQMSVDPQNIQLWHSNQVKELADLATIADQEIEHDNILYMCLRPSETDPFEEISVPKMDEGELAEPTAEK